MTCRPTIIAILICLAGGAGAQVHHWEETPSETIWRGRYTNCDKGWAVDLPPGVVAHDGLPPSPNHGFLISTVNPSTTARVTLDEPRIIDIYDEYDVMTLGSARAYLDSELKDAKDGGVLRVRSTVLQGMRGVQARYRPKAGNSIVESIVVLRRGIVYHLFLRTTDQDYKADSTLFARIREGFRFLPLPTGACVNP